jgi:imidazolonepropionase-like amidohydrolase
MRPSSGRSATAPPPTLLAVLASALLAAAAAACASAPPAPPSQPSPEAAKPGQAAGERAAGQPKPSAPGPAAASGQVPAPVPVEDPAAYPSTYAPPPAPPVLIANATVLTAAGERIEHGSVLLRDGKIAAVGKDLQAPAGARRVDGAGKWVTPGLVDPHSHLGVYASPEVDAHSDGNEATDPDTAEVWAEHSVWPQDPQFPLALAGGVTTMQILPGSANLFGGRSVTVKNVPARGVSDMKFPGAPYGLKMACGENPKRVYGSRNRAPSTRMGNVAGYREAWIKAQKYRYAWQEYRDKKAAGKDATPPDRDLKLDTLAGVLEGRILVQNHCYRADEMLVMLAIAREFGFHVAAFHHAVEAYKIADVLAKEGVCADMWADWWGFKMEALDGIRENVALVARAGGCACLHSDSAEGIQRLNQEAAKAMAAGERAGISIAPEDAIRWITINPARSLGIDRQTGSLEPGKMADVVVWSGNPFSVYSRAEKVYIDGVLAFDRDDPARQPATDFELGLRDPAAAQGVQP